MLFYGFTGFVVVPLNSYITAVRGSLSVTRALTLISALFNLGGFIGAWAGGMVSQAIGLRSTYGIASALFLLSFGLILLIRKQPHEPIALNQRYNALFKNKLLGRFLLLACIAMFAMYLGWPLTPNFLQNERFVSLGAIGVFGSMHGLGVVLLNLSLGRLIPRTGFLLAQFAVGCSTILLWRGLDLPFYAMGYFLAGGYRLSWSLVNAQVEGLVNKSELGLTFGFVETTFGIVMICAPPIAGYLYNLTPDLPYRVGLIMVGLSLLLTLAFAPHQKSKSLSQEPDPV
jgi:predicted MFS family arabinose efflux permease